ncbi:HlyD family efflux transporter periplasmic adaptor subunit [Paractinoplanes rhizophilus]|uniref:HlyD family efflux transporter periplasmic adaptor subunit n=1 Tax=Paractinoplanes rhizophilus TaxID=1416877 RepID=A0ABW2HJH8_9ACTN
MSRRRGAITVVAIAVTAPLAAGVAYAARAQPTAADAPAAEISTGTATVARGTLTQTTQLSGMLRYTGSYSADYQGAPGILTSAPAPGAAIGRGGVLFRVSDAPVRLLLGAVPAFRDFGYGMSDGPDVRQLETNLVALGFDPHRRITVDRHFSAATAAAIRRWEASWGRPSYRRTGRLALGQVVFLPATIRVTAQQVRAGAAVAPGTTVLTGTSTNRAVVAQVDTAQAATLHVNDKVEVSLPDVEPIPGRVAAIGRVATAPTGGSSDGPGDPNAATVPVTVTVRLPRGFALDQVPVTVDVIVGTRSGVLLAPIAALLARPGGGYQVRLAGGALVPVEPGRFDQGTGRVEIVSGLTEGQSVEVPAA